MSFESFDPLIYKKVADTDIAALCLITHLVTNLTTDQKEMDLIVLSELIDFLNNAVETSEMQKIKYEA